MNLSGVGKHKCEMFAEHPSSDSHLSYRLALVYLVFRLLPLIRKISVYAHRAHFTAEEDERLSMMAGFLSSFTRLVSKFESISAVISYIKYHRFIESTYYADY